MRLFIVAWCAYGEWKSATAFVSEAAAQKHIDNILLRKDPRTGEVERDYNKLCQVIPIDVRDTDEEVYNPYEQFGEPNDQGLTAATDEEAAASIDEH